jgi:hypothetical protein
MNARQSELFGTDVPLCRGAEPIDYSSMPDKVRPRLHKMLAELRNAHTMPWEYGRLLLNRTIFPQMANWLPEEEAERLRAEFTAELTRLSPVGA